MFIEMIQMFKITIVIMKTSVNHGLVVGLWNKLKKYICEMADMNVVVS